MSAEEAGRKPGSPVSSSEGPDVKHSPLALRLILSVESKRERVLCSGAGLWPYPPGFPSVAEGISAAWQSGWPSCYVGSEDSRVTLFAFCPPDPPANGRCTAPQLLQHWPSGSSTIISAKNWTAVYLHLAESETKQKNLQSQHTLKGYLERLMIIKVTWQTKKYFSVL